MKRKFENPLRGAPATTEKRCRDGKWRYIVAPRVLTPQRAKLADWLSGVATFCISAAVGVAVLNDPFPLTWGTLLGAGAFAAWLCLAVSALLKTVLRRTTEIRMSEDEIAVRRLFFWRRYQRSLPHAFRLQPHDREDDERIDLDYESRVAAKNGEVLKTKPYYGRSFHVVLDFLGHRIDLLSVYGAKEAVAIVARLQYIDALLNGMQGRSGGLLNEER